MAFKSNIAANIGTSTSPTQITPAVAADTTATLIGLSIANTSTAPIYGSAKLNKNGGSSAFLIKDAVIIPGGALVIIGGDQKLVVETGDTVTVYSSAANSADAITSYLI